MHPEHVCKTLQKDEISKNETFFKTLDLRLNHFEIALLFNQKLQNVETIKDE